jgi:glycosyltransferase involved in cell wall biosynthesis/aminoglycoside phosphotransferase (APT) family kinase protein
MRVVVLCTDQGVRVPGAKGASLHLRSVATSYARLGHETLLLGVAGHGTPPTAPGLRTVLLPHPGRAEGVLREFNKLALVERFVTDALAVVEDFAPDLVHERLSLFGTAGARLAGAVGARHVVEVNTLLAREEAQWRGLAHVALAEQRELQTLRAADHVVTVSAELTRAVRDLLADDPGASVATVPNGVDPELFAGPLDAADVRQRAGVPVGARLVVFSGTLRPWHGVDVAVDALTSLDPDVHLVVVGDGPVRADLAARAAGLGVADRLHLVGQVPHEQAVALARSADVAIAPYPDLPDFSFSPLKVYEYLAAGVPVVASDLGQIRALLHGLGVGTLVTPGDPRALAAGVAAALRGGRGPALARAAEAVRTRASWDARIGEVLTGLAAVCARAAHAGPLGALAELGPEDAALADALGRASADDAGALSGVHLGRLLRRVPGRRATFAGNRSGEPVVVKAFASPRARGNARRLSALAAAGLGDVVPSALATSSDGHVGLVSFRPGTVMEDLADEEFTRAAGHTGRVLRRLHDSGAHLDRRWTHADEQGQLLRRAPDGCRAAAAAEAARPLSSHAVVPSHRDLHPRQVVALENGAGVCLIDLDDAALAPAGLDVGNMTAHLRREAVLGRRTPQVAEAAIRAFLAGYGTPPPDLVTWERLSLARLAGLAESRHGRPEERDALLRLLDARPVPAPAPEPVLTGGLVPTGHADRPVRLCVDDATGRAVVVKTYLGADGSRVHDDMVALWGSPFGRHVPPRMPEPLAFNGASGDLVMARVAGRALAVRGTVGDAVRRGPEAARLLAALHGAGVALHRVRDRRALVRSARRKAGSLADHQPAQVRDAFATAVAAIEEAWEGTASGILVPSHGDFSPRNVHATADHLALIDLDRLQLAERERDLAYWCAWLWVTRGGADDLFGGPVHPFLEAYTAASGHEPDPVTLDVHAALALVRIAHGWTSMRADDASRLHLLRASTAMARGVLTAGRR